MKTKRTKLRPKTAKRRNGNYDNVTRKKSYVSFDDKLTVIIPDTFTVTLLTMWNRLLFFYQRERKYTKSILNTRYLRTKLVCRNFGLASLVNRGSRTNYELRVTLRTTYYWKYLFGRFNTFYMRIVASVHFVNPGAFLASCSTHRLLVIYRSSIIKAVMLDTTGCFCTRLVFLSYCTVRNTSSVRSKHFFYSK